MVQLGYLCLFRHYFPLVYYAIPYLHSELKAKKKSCYLFMVVSQMISQRLSLLRVTMLIGILKHIGTTKLLACMCVRARFIGNL